MDEIKKILMEQIKTAEKASSILQESIDRVAPILSNGSSKELTPSERETCEALTSRFSRLSDLLVQRLFRTIDEAELIFEGTLIDRLNRMEKRGVITSSAEWRSLRILRNDIAHEYLMDEAKGTLNRAFQGAPLMVEAVKRVKEYCSKKNLI